MIRAAIRAVDYHLPEARLSNDDLAREHPEWSVEKIASKTGIDERRIAAEGECASDLAVAAATKLFVRGVVQPDQVDYLLLCTQTPDHFLPTTACLVQSRLGLPTTAGALDLNLGCSGYVYGLGLAKGLVESGQAERVLFLTADTYSKVLDREDKGVRTIFGDGAAATLIERTEGDRDALGPFAVGTDGRGAEHLIVARGGFRHGPGGERPTLHMNGPEIFTFTLRVVPPLIAQLLERAACRLDDVDLFVFHQANEFMLEHLRNKLRIPREKFFVGMRRCGNTVSSTIPIALCDAAAEGRLPSGARVMLVGFGVGYSWGATLIRWP
ncbi:MAG: ketoacyl-ACP synthase III [Deltaproteobacteria bacterium]|nr:ketoacyl-ACP synthase III [Deltaproteobacteria bacterium]